MLIKNKKIKNSLFTALALIASSISVVACGTNNNGDDDNYKKFSNLVNNLDLKDFVSANSSFSLLKKNEFKDNKSLNFSISDKNLNVNNICLFNLNSEDKKNKLYHLSDLNNGFINILDDNKITIKMGDDGKLVSLDNILFAENFDINVEDTAKNASKEKIFTNVTAFFKLTEDTKDPKSLNVIFKQWDDNLALTPPSTEGYKLQIDGGKDSLLAKEYNLGLSEKNNFFYGDKDNFEKKFESKEKPLKWDDTDKMQQMRNFILFDALKSNTIEIDDKSVIHFSNCDNLVGKWSLSLLENNMSLTTQASLYSQFTNGGSIANLNNNFMLEFPTLKNSFF
ncbi:hypothetical protein JTY60_01825 [symbiont of Argiope bruennichi]|uniref:hypothetical protein n=1 Tax=symbiont of Argiope bruennichi TaxID=2810479 RepID=UPI003DA5D9B0